MALRVTAPDDLPDWLEDARRNAQWALLHGLPRLAMRRRVRVGEHLATFVAHPDSREDPTPVLDRMRAAGPFAVQYGIAVTARHAVASAVLRDPRFAAAGPRVVDLPPWLDTLVGATQPHIAKPTTPPSMLVTEGDEHDRYRRLVSRAFTPRAIEALRARAEEIADELLTGFESRPRGAGADIAAEYAALLPVTIIAEMLGVPVSRRAEFLAWGNAIAPGLELGLPRKTYLRGLRGIEELNEFFDQHFAAVRRNPGDDILSRLVTVEEDGRGLDRLELLSTAILLLAAGFETTVNLIGNGAKLLMDNPGQLRLLQEEPARWGGAVEEILRIDSPVQVTSRVSTEDVDVAGAHVPAGRRVVVILAGANRDPGVFADPGRFDVLRSNAREHLAFSAGSHFCLGAALARLEGEVGLKMLFDRFPDLAASGPARRRSTVVLRGWEHLPVELGRAAVSAPERSASRILRLV